MTIERCRVVLVRPEIAGNIGSTARAMRNFGLRDLVLVAPIADPHSEDARRLSTHGESVLKSMHVVATLRDAIGDCSFVVGTSARSGGLYRDSSHDTPEQVIPRMIAAMSAGPAALVFGPEPSGLTNEEISRCHALIRIPTEPECPALNLSHAVAVCLYELRQHWLAASGTTSETEPPASDAELEQMFEHLRDSLERIHYLYGDKADALMHGLRRLISRAAPTLMEVKLLHGLARQLEWIADPNRHRSSGRLRE
jgi:tRNA/rRNA methyltransferase